MKNKDVEVKFSYVPKIDRTCWKRYNAVIKENKDVWGIKRDSNQILKFKKVELVANIKNITTAYDKVFSVRPTYIKGYIVTTPFSMIDDDKRISKGGTIYLSLFTSNPHLVLAHEIFHIYFEKYTKRNIPNYEEVKEYFTVILNDLFGDGMSKGYPKHEEIRRKVYICWLKTKSIDECIKLVSTQQ